MAIKFKSDIQVKKLASELKTRREERGLTLKNIEDAQGVDASQISRFEKGLFKTYSENLQKLADYLQVNLNFEYEEISGLGKRFESFAATSSKHRAVAEDLLSALEKLR